MKILTYSDIHLEFGSGWRPPSDISGDVMLLAGDIITFEDFEPLRDFLTGWQKPVLYITGNHEYYGVKMDEAEKTAQEWIAKELPHVRFLRDESVSIDGVHFFGGTMWTDFNKADWNLMFTAHRRMNDYRVIKSPKGEHLQPEDTVAFHKNYVRRLKAWLKKDLKGPRVVMSHHAPIPHPPEYHRYDDSRLEAAYISLDMMKIIDRYQPDLWVYGHTHQPNDQTFGKTRIISNPRGYPLRGGGSMCEDFDPYGKPVTIEE